LRTAPSPFPPASCSSFRRKWTSALSAVLLYDLAPQQVDFATPPMTSFFRAEETLSLLHRVLSGHNSFPRRIFLFSRAKLAVLCTLFRARAHFSGPVFPPFDQWCGKLFPISSTLRIRPLFPLRACSSRSGCCRSVLPCLPVCKVIQRLSLFKALPLFGRLSSPFMA